MIDLERSTVSEPDLTPDGFTFLALKSSHLQGRGEVTVYVPDVLRDSEDIPCVLLLHGVYGGHFSWTYSVGAHKVLDALINKGSIKPMALVIPSDGHWGDGTGYFRHHGYDFEKWICEDVLQGVYHFISGINAASTHFITGLSMGGFGAMYLGIRHRDRFQAISAHSSITSIEDLRPYVAENLEEQLSVSARKGLDIASLAIRYKAALPALRFDCGLSDDLLEANRVLHKKLVAADIQHSYEEFPGAHERPYWRKHVEDTFRFFSGLHY